MRVALFGGTFDPPHLGHIAVACAALQQFTLDTVLFVPAAQSPHKTNTATPYQERFALVECALRDAQEARFAVSDLESPQRTSGPNYSVDTIKRFTTEHPSEELFFIIGMDQLASFRRWREPVTILKLAQLIVATRSGWSYDAIRQALPASIRDDQSLMSHIHLLDGVYEDVTSTRLRIAARGGRFAEQWLSPSVLAHIRARGLYQHSEHLQSE